MVHLKTILVQMVWQFLVALIIQRLLAGQRFQMTAKFGSQIRTLQPMKEITMLNYYRILMTNTNTYWNETFISNTTAGYDRIVTEIATQPNTSYTVKFFSKLGGRLTSSHAGPTNTLLQVQSEQTNMAFSDQFVEQSNWTEKNYQFTTDATTTTVYLLFSAIASNHSSIQLQTLMIYKRLFRHQPVTPTMTVFQII